MPMKRELYPENWDCIALLIKWFADWKCKRCGRPCLRPEQDWFDLVYELVETKWHEETCDEIGGRSVEKKGRFILTVAHLDQDPGNNDRDNLMALCSVCHLRHDAPHNAKKAAKTRFEQKHKNQLKLF